MTATTFIPKLFGLLVIAFLAFAFGGIAQISPDLGAALLLVISVAATFWYFHKEEE